MKMDNIIENFKAKFGVSNKRMAHILCVNSEEMVELLKTHSFTGEQIDLTRSIEGLIENIIQDGHILNDKMPYLSVMQQKLDIQEMNLKSVRSDLAKNRENIRRLRRLGWFDRILFIFNKGQIIQLVEEKNSSPIQYFL
jgi:hypothetical protein